LLDAQPFVMANLVNFAVLLLKAKVGLPSISSVQIDRQRSRLARLVLTDSYRGIALSGSNTTLPSIIRLGGVGRFRCPKLLSQCPESEQYRQAALISLACMEEGASAA
jgi:hypothetical protein